MARLFLNIILEKAGYESLFFDSLYDEAVEKTLTRNDSRYFTEYLKKMIKENISARKKL